MIPASLTSIPNPNTGTLWDVATIIIVAAMMSVPSWFAIKAHRTSREVRDQVVNGHGDAPNLREDVDRVIASIDALARDVTAIRKDLADEEQRRQNHFRELREEVNRKISDLHDRFKHN